MRRTYKYKFYSARKRKRLYTQIDCAAEIWNFCVKYTRTYYRLYNKQISKSKLQKYLTQVKKQEKYKHWNQLGSQAIQEVTDRLYRSYKAYFIGREKGRKVSLPSCRKIRKYKSFTLKQAGYKLLEGNKIRIGNVIYKYSKSRDIEGDINTITIKRNALGELFLYVSCTVPNVHPKLVTSGNIVGYDFGMKTFLTGSDGSKIVSPLFFTTNLKEFQRAGRNFSRKKKGSNNRLRSYFTLVRKYYKLKNSRKDSFHKLAKELTEKYTVICIEDLNIAAMKKLWGRKISDLAFSEFVAILKHHCAKAGTNLVIIDRWYPSSKECHICRVINKDLSLKDRVWTCGTCKTTHQRDFNAAKNIERVGASTLGLSEVRPTMLASTV